MAYMNRALILAVLAAHLAPLVPVRAQADTLNFSQPLEISDVLFPPTKVVASDPGPFELFGSSIAITPRHLFVGGYWDGNPDEHTGAVYVYQRRPSDASSPRFREVAKLIAGTTERQYLGWSVAADGPVVVAGAPAEGRGNGAAYLFELNEQTGEVATSVRIPPPPRGRFVGREVALSGETLVVASWRSDSDRGAVYVFSKPAAGWGTLDPQAYTKLSLPQLPSHSSRFGISVVIDGDTILVGAPHFERDDGNRGAVFVFERPPQGWGSGVGFPAAELLTDQWNVSFGHVLAMHQDLLAVSAPNTFNEEREQVGAVHLFRRPAGGWASPPTQPLTILQGSGVGHRSSFGSTSLAAGPGAVLVGAPGDSFGGFGLAGAAYLFLEPSSGWQDHHGTEDLKLVAPDGEEDELFGRSVRLDRQGIFVGASRHTVTNPSQGAVYAFGFLPQSVLEIPILGLDGIILLAVLLGLIGWRTATP